MAVGVELLWASRPRGHKSSGSGGSSEKSLESRLAVVTVEDSKKLRREKREMEKRGERLRDD